MHNLPISPVNFIGTKRPAQDALALGDPWTMIAHDALIDEATGKLLDVGNVFTKIFSTAEPAKAFRITAVNYVDGRRWTYQSIFIGFAIIDDAAKTYRIEPTWKGSSNEP